MGSQFSMGNGAVGIISWLEFMPGGSGGAPPGTGGGGAGAAGMDGGKGGGGGAGTIGEGGGRGAVLRTKFGIVKFSAFSSFSLISSSFFCMAS